MFEAAEVIGCSAIELDEHPDKRKWMARAFTVKYGRNEGEYQKELNPEYRRIVNTAGEKLAKARKDG